MPGPNPRKPIQLQSKGLLKNSRTAAMSELLTKSDTTKATPQIQDKVGLPTMLLSDRYRIINLKRLCHDTNRWSGFAKQSWLRGLLLLDDLLGPPTDVLVWLAERLLKTRLYLHAVVRRNLL